jgi:hypothetical protein
VYSGSGSSATEIGSITTGEDVTNLLGLTNTQLVVTGATAADGGSTSDLPTVGSVLDAMNFGNGYENVYTATPGADGTVTDTLVTPYGNINLDSLFGSINDANPLNPADALTGLQSGDSAIGADAFSIGGTTFDPTLASGAEGFTPVEQLLGAPPLLDLGGGTPTIFGITLSLASQDFNVYDGTATTDQIGSITTNDEVTNLLGLTNTEFTVTGATPLGDTPVADLPTDGTVYDVLNLGGLENVYTAIPGVDGGADTITDTLVTPFGNVDLSSLFAGLDAVSALDPGAAFGSGLDAATAAASAIDPLAFLGL